jgi:hypothetical protein
MSRAGQFGPLYLRAGFCDTLVTNLGSFMSNETSTIATETTPRVEWQKPAMRVLDAADAEGGAIAGGDAPFLFS